MKTSKLSLFIHTYTKSVNKFVLRDETPTEIPKFCLLRFVSFYFLLSTLSLSSLLAQEIEVGGYLKDMLSYSDGNYKGMPDNIGLWQNTLQGRLNLNAYAGDFTLSVQSRHLLIYRKNQKDAQQFFDVFQVDNGYTDLDWSYFSKQDLLASGEIDRLYLDWSRGNFQITAGRQRIAWGSALVWNISDFFNPFNILDFDYEEKPGSDAIRFQYYTGPMSQFDIAFAPSKNKHKQMLALRYLVNLYKFDFNLMAAWQGEKERFGFNWAGELFTAGFRGEVVYTNPDLGFFPISFKPPERSYVPPFKEIDSPYWNMVLSLDYTFVNSFYIHSEYLYNELGVTQNSALRSFEILQTGELSPSRHSLFQELAYDLTPLLRVNYFILFNPSDHSQISVPSLQYSLSDNWGLYALAFLSSGKTNSEFGGYPAQYFLRLKYSF